MIFHIKIIVILIVICSHACAEMDGFNKTSYQEVMNQQSSPKKFKLNTENKYKVTTPKKNKKIKQTKRSRQNRKSNKKNNKSLSFEEMTIMMAERR